MFPRLHSTTSITHRWEEQRGLSSDYARHDYWPTFAPFIAQCTTLTPTHSRVSINCVPAPPCIPLQKDSSETNRASRFLILTEFQTRCRSNSSTVSRRDTHIAILKSLSTMRRCTQRRPPKFQAGKSEEPVNNCLGTDTVQCDREMLCLGPRYIR